MIYVALICFALALFGFLSMKKKQKEAQRPSPVRVRTITDIVYPVDQENADVFFSFYEMDLDENDDYDLSAKELKEDFEDEKVYRYDPYQLEYKIEDGQVFAKTDEWLHIGRMKKGQEIPKDALLFLYPNIYKKVTDEEITKESGNHYFGFEIKKKVGI